MKSVLTIIDMQDYFLRRGLRRSEDPKTMQAEWDAIVNVIRGQIVLAKRKKMPIVVLEYNNSGATTAKILRAIRGYALARRVVKRRDDGSNEVAETVSEIMGCDWNPTEFCVTGVNRAYCVARTVSGLSLEFPDSILSLIEDGIGDEHGDTGWGWEWQGTGKPKNAIIANSRAVA